MSLEPSRSVEGAALSAFADRARLGPGTRGLGVGVYARLLRGRVRSALEDLLPRTAALLGPARVGDVVEAQLATGTARSPLFRLLGEALSHEVAALAERDATLPPWAPALARYEWLRFAVATAERDEGVFGPLAGERAVVFTRAAALLESAYRVHEDCAPGETRLLVARAAHGALQVHALSPEAHTLLAALFAAEPLGAAIAAMEAAHGVDPARCLACATLVAELAEAGIVLGAGRAP